MLKVHKVREKSVLLDPEDITKSLPRYQGRGQEEDKIGVQKLLTEDEGEDKSRVQQLCGRTEGEAEDKVKQTHHAAPESEAA